MLMQQRLQGLHTFAKSSQLPEWIAFQAHNSLGEWQWTGCFPILNRWWQTNKQEKKLLMWETSRTQPLPGSAKRILHLHAQSPPSPSLQGHRGKARWGESLTSCSSIGVKEWGTCAPLWGVKDQGELWVFVCTQCTCACVCMWVCMCMRACLRVCVCARTHTCGIQRLTSGFFLSHSPPLKNYSISSLGVSHNAFPLYDSWLCFSGQTISLMDPEAHQLGYTSSPSPSTGVTGAHHSVVFLWSWGSRLRPQTHWLSHCSSPGRRECI